MKPRNTRMGSTMSETIILIAAIAVAVAFAVFYFGVGMIRETTGSADAIGVLEV